MVFEKNELKEGSLHYTLESDNTNFIIAANIY